MPVRWMELSLTVLESIWIPDQLRPEPTMVQPSRVRLVFARDPAIEM